MAILHSCCWWRSVRRGAFASVFYTFIYFGSSCIIVSSFLHDERQYLAGEVDAPLGESFLEKETISAATVIFNILLLCCATCGLFASVLVVIALKCDRRELLVPWIGVMVVDILVEFVHFIYLLINETLHFEPLTATLFTIDLFIVCLNLYCLLCVISQYQELRAGRGGARQDQHNAQTAHIQYTPAAHTIHHQRTPKTSVSPTYAPSARLMVVAVTTANGRPGGSLKQAAATAAAAAVVVDYDETGASHHNCAIKLDEAGQPNGSNATCPDAGKLNKKHVQFPDDVLSAPDDHQRPQMAHHQHRLHAHHSGSLSQQQQQQQQQRQLCDSCTCGPPPASDAVASTRSVVVIAADDAASTGVYCNGGAPPAYDVIEWCDRPERRVFDNII